LGYRAVSMIHNVADMVVDADIAVDTVAVAVQKENGALEHFAQDIVAKNNNIFYRVDTLFFFFFLFVF